MKTVILDPIFGPSIPVELDNDGFVYLDGERIGKVYKTTRTYSPPTHRGSRIVKYHKQVKCWGADISPGRRLARGISYETRKLALLALVEHAKDDAA